MTGDSLGLRVLYNGTSFDGFQRQSHKKTVQGELERILSTIFRKSVTARFSSRTDKGVHSKDQFVVIDGGYDLLQGLSSRDRDHFRLSINALSRDRISCWQVLRVKPAFHFGKHILWKEYHYELLNSPVCDPLLEDRVWWIRTPLPLEKLREAMSFWKGTQDFSSMTRKRGLHGRDPIRNMMVSKMIVTPHDTIPQARHIIFVFRADGFLQHQVRNMVGTTVEYARGHAHDILKILNSKDRNLAGGRAPSRALTLHKTKVKSGLFKVLAN